MPFVTNSLNDLFRSMYWDTLEIYLRGRMTELLNKLKSCDPEELGKLQGQIKEIEITLNLPHLQKGD